ncbi:MAG TPA: bifunctional DNA-formamidopyrimidine glycosylase/DNA-(apurinic or apyrimidinic site) lyase [Candidatus Saccharimonadales bacterium]|nr:bifunctional DNA-formamidopyrimidine glycosylase/DNA-(apurinic or apyrimidinic site) lyase [Candidatus Saccharimonadales bacterium]
MPELPEVETIRRGLSQLIVGRVIANVQVNWAKTWPLGVSQLESKVIKSKVESLDRRAKVLIINLANPSIPDTGYSLLFHLKMTGQLVLVRAGGERFAGGHPTESMQGGLPDKSTRVIFTFDNGDQLFFNDQRKFGWVQLVESQQVKSHQLIARLGPEPLSDDFSVERFALNVKRHPKSPVKATILDQSTVSGIGNIYADESLHLARIHPARLGGSLKPVELKRLHAGIRDIITLGIQHGGTSFTNYVNALGRKGDYLDNARVFRRQGQSCPARLPDGQVCGTTIEKIRVAGRGTHVCPNCQKLERK